MQTRQRMAFIACTLLLAGSAAVRTRASAEPQARVLTADGFNGLYTALAFSPDGKILATYNFWGQGDQGGFKLSFWDVASGKQLRAATDTPPAGAMAPSLAFSPDGSTLAGAFNGLDISEIRLWDSQSGALKTKIKADATRLPHRHVASGIAFTPDGKRLAGASTIKAFVWDVATGEAQELALKGLGPVCIRPDGRAVVGLRRADNGVMEIWPLPAGPRTRTIDTDLGDYHDRQVFFSPDNDTVCCWDEGSGMFFWSAKTGKERAGGKIPSMFQPVALSADGTKVAALHAHMGEMGSDEAGAWNVQTGARIWSAQALHYGPAAFSPDSGTLAIVEFGGIRILTFAK